MMLGPLPLLKRIFLIDKPSMYLGSRWAPAKPAGQNNYGAANGTLLRRLFITHLWGGVGRCSCTAGFLVSNQTHSSAEQHSQFVSTVRQAACFVVFPLPFQISPPNGGPVGDESAEAPGPASSSEARSVGSGTGQQAAALRLRPPSVSRLCPKERGWTSRGELRNDRPADWPPPILPRFAAPGGVEG